MTETKSLLAEPKKHAATILREANSDAIEICQLSLEYFIKRLRTLPPSVACDAEDIAGKCQQYLKKYGD